MFYPCIHMIRAFNRHAFLHPIRSTKSNGKPQLRLHSMLPFNNNIIQKIRPLKIEDSCHCCELPHHQLKLDLRFVIESIQRNCMILYNTWDHWKFAGWPVLPKMIIDVIKKIPFHYLITNWNWIRDLTLKGTEFHSLWAIRVWNKGKSSQLCQSSVSSWIMMIALNLVSERSNFGC